MICPRTRLWRLAKDKIAQETRFYITSLVLAARLVGPVIRSHWVVENSLHWVLDMVFRDRRGKVFCHLTFRIMHRRHRMQLVA